MKRKPLIFIFIVLLIVFDKTEAEEPKIVEYQIIKLIEEFKNLLENEEWERVKINKIKLEEDYKNWKNEIKEKEEKEEEIIFLNWSNWIEENLKKLKLIFPKWNDKIIKIIIKIPKEFPEWSDAENYRKLLNLFSNFIGKNDENKQDEFITYLNQLYYGQERLKELKEDLDEIGEYSNKISHNDKYKYNGHLGNLTSGILDLIKFRNKSDQILSKIIFSVKNYPLEYNYFDSKLEETNKEFKYLAEIGSEKYKGIIKEFNEYKEERLIPFKYEKLNKFIECQKLVREKNEFLKKKEFEEILKYFIKNLNFLNTIINLIEERKELKVIIRNIEIKIENLKEEKESKMFIDEMNLIKTSLEKQEKQVEMLEGKENKMKILGNKLEKKKKKLEGKKIGKKLEKKLVRLQEKEKKLEEEKVELKLEMEKLEEEKKQNEEIIKKKLELIKDKLKKRESYNYLIKNLGVMKKYFLTNNEEENLKNEEELLDNLFDIIIKLKENENDENIWKKYKKCKKNWKMPIIKDFNRKILKEEELNFLENLENYSFNLLDRFIIFETLTFKENIIKNWENTKTSLEKDKYKNTLNKLKFLIKKLKRWSGRQKIMLNYLINFEKLFKTTVDVLGRFIEGNIIIKMEDLVIVYKQMCLYSNSNKSALELHQRTRNLILASKSMVKKINQNDYLEDSNDPQKNKILKKELKIAQKLTKNILFEYIEKLKELKENKEIYLEKSNSYIKTIYWDMEVPEIEDLSLMDIMSMRSDMSDTFSLRHSFSSDSLSSMMSGYSNGWESPDSNVIIHSPSTLSIESLDSLSPESPKIHHSSFSSSPDSNIQSRGSFESLDSLSPETSNSLSSSSSMSPTDSIERSIPKSLSQVSLNNSQQFTWRPPRSPSSPSLSTLTDTTKLLNNQREKIIKENKQHWLFHSNSTPSLTNLKPPLNSKNKNIIKKKTKNEKIREEDKEQIVKEIEENDKKWNEWKAEILFMQRKTEENVNWLYGIFFDFLKNVEIKEDNEEIIEIFSQPISELPEKVEDILSDLFFATI